MTTQEENELICERLLGWEVRRRFGNNPCWLFFPDGRVANGPYSFTTWAEAGLILEALQGSELKPAGRACESLAHELIDGGLTPALVRAAALEYIKQL